MLVKHRTESEKGIDKFRDISAVLLLETEAILDCPRTNSTYELLECVDGLQELGHSDDLWACVEILNAMMTDIIEETVCPGMQVAEELLELLRNTASGLDEVVETLQQNRRPSEDESLTTKLLNAAGETAMIVSCVSELYGMEEESYDAELASYAIKRMKCLSYELEAGMPAYRAVMYLFNRYLKVEAIQNDWIRKEQERLKTLSRMC
jgi:hypothetical protein